MSRLDSPGGRLRFARTRRGMTQTDLAWMVGTSQPLISIWERDRALPRLDVQDVLADALGTSRLFGDGAELRTFRHLIGCYWDEITALAASIHRGVVGQEDLLAAIDGQHEPLAAVLDAVG